jgi:hypothetical protein
MKIFLHKISAFVLAILLVISTISLTVEKHFCGSTLIDVALFSSTKKCCDGALSQSSKPTLKKESCCKDIIEIIPCQDKLDTKSLENLIPVQKQIFSPFCYTYKHLLKECSEKLLPCLDYQTPILVYDITVIDQVFLI